MLAAVEALLAHSRHVEPLQLIVSGAATNVEQTVAIAFETRSDVESVDYSMPLMSGPEVGRRALQHGSPDLDSALE
ncbi:hypothetical protein [Bradyrhizobium arachidis]|uniref:hypothetical protein n=1 Tax=Bradyrhizobium arachidis TaxID=858423 RepID=UPI00216193A6|nr:hypothetical protein [Bradyrhizobium arachidis]